MNIPAPTVSPDFYTLFAREYYREPDMLQTDPRRLAVKMCCFCINNALTGLEETIAKNTKLSVEEVQDLLEFCTEKLNPTQPKP